MNENSKFGFKKNIEKLIADFKNVYEYEIAYPFVGLKAGFSLICIFVALSIMNVCIGHIRTNNIAAGIITGCFALIFIIVPIILYKSKNPDIPINILLITTCAIMTYYLIVGFKDGINNFWIYLLTYATIIYLGLFRGFWIGLYFSLLSILLMWTPIYHLCPCEYDTVYRISFPLFQLFFFGFIVYINLVYKTYQMNSIASENSLKKEIKLRQKINYKMIESFVGTISRLIDEKDIYTKEHSLRVAKYSQLILAEYGMATDELLNNIYRCALLHDIGKIGIPDDILKKESRLTDAEYKIMKMHPVWGSEILKNLSFIEGADIGAAYHHERYDGFGYPNQLKAEEIPLIARIISAADALDAMSSNRCYRKKCTKEYIISEFQKGSGTQFEPHIAEIVCKLIEHNILRISTEQKGDSDDI